MRFNWRLAGSVMLTVMLTGNMPSGSVTLVTCVPEHVTLVTHAK